MDTHEAKRVLETALICAQQPLPLRDMRTLFDDQVGPDTIRSLLDELARDWAGRYSPDDVIGIHVGEIELIRQVLFFEVVYLEGSDEFERKAGFPLQLVDNRFPDGIELPLLELGTDAE